MFTECFVFLILYLFLLKYNSTLWIGWVIFAGSIPLGSALSYITYTRKFFAALIVGIGSGCSLALVLQNAVVYLIQFEYSIHIVIGTICFFTIIMTYVFMDYAFNVGIAMIASFLIMRGVALFLDYRYEFAIYYEKHEF